MKINKKKMPAYLLLLVATWYLWLVNLQEAYNIFNYTFLLVLIIFSIVLFNRESLISANTLFTVYFCYTVAFGPMILLNKGIDYGFNYFTVILGSFLCFAWGNGLVVNAKFHIPQHDKGFIRVKFSRKWALRFVFLLSMIASAFYLLKNRMYILGGNISVGRVDAMSGNGLILYASQLCIVAVPMMYDLYFQGKQDCRHTISRYEVVICAVISAMMLIVSGFRAPVMTLVVCLAVLYIQKNNIKSSSIIKIGVTMIFAVELLGIARNSMSGVKGAGFFTSLGTSIVVNCINLRYVFNTFPAKTPFQHGYTYLLNLIMLLPGPDPDFTLWLKDQIGITFAGGGVTPTIIGEFYINFNMIGIYVGMFLLGILGVYVYRYFRKYSCTFLGGYYLWQYAHCASGGISNVMIPVMLFTFVYWCLMSCPIYRRESRGLQNG